jgi:5'-nucleotidase (lipoprotein e(P4) family)
MVNLKKYAMFLKFLTATLYCLILFTGFSSCNSSTTGNNSANDPTAPAPAKRDDEVVMATLYQQRAAEYRALCLQAYNLAGRRIEACAKEKPGNDTLAVVTDLDETALDNSGNEAWLLVHDSTYNPTEFNDWCKLAKAKAVPGSVDFFNYVNTLKDRKKRKINIYYVSNRVDALKQVTIDNLSRLGFPQVEVSHVLLRTGAASKEERRQEIIKQHNKIVVLLGDNLIDLDKRFDTLMKNPDLRIAMVDSLQKLWGDKYIVFPNAEYGDWEGALYDGKYKPLAEEKAIRESKLIPYDK